MLQVLYKCIPLTFSLEYVKNKVLAFQLFKIRPYAQSLRGNPAQCVSASVLNVVIFVIKTIFDLLGFMFLCSLF